MTIDTLLKNPIRKLTLLGTLALTATAYNPAEAAMMELSSYNQIGNTFIYEFENTSASGAANNGIDFTLPAGTNHGITSATSDIDGDAWNVSVLANSTVFDYDNGNLAAWVPGEIAVFELNRDPLYSGIGTDLGLATATARGSVEPIPFNDVEVQRPSIVPEPGTLALLGLGGLALLRRGTQKRERYQTKTQYK